MNTIQKIINRIFGEKRRTLSPTFKRQSRKPLTNFANLNKRGLIMTHDVAFQFRMGAGFAGDVNRVHPASIEPVLIDVNAPPLLYGEGVVVDATTSGVRPFSAADTGLTGVYGITVRPYPTQAPSATQQYGGQPFGGEVPPTSGVMDVLRSGYILGKVNGTTAKDGAVYIWCAASTGSHVQGQFESASSGGNTASIANAKFNGVPDANGIVEIFVWPAV